MKPKTASNLLNWGTGFSLLGALMVLISGYGYQWGWWHFSFGFQLIPIGTGLAVIAGIIAIVGYFKIADRSQKQAVAGGISLLVIVVALTNVGYWASEVAKGYPPIHDITTDTSNPPKFQAIIPLRADAPNPPEYIPEESRSAQESFYTDIEPLVTPYGYDEAYDRALEAARDMDWNLVAENREEGRIEAYEKLAWYGFIDDVVVRVDTFETGSIIDIRSKSRIGKGDLGVNAKRIRSYIDEFQN